MTHRFFKFGLIPEFTGPVAVTGSNDLGRDFADPASRPTEKAYHLSPIHRHSGDQGVALEGRAPVFEQIADVALELTGTCVLTFSRNWWHLSSTSSPTIPEVRRVAVDSLLHAAALLPFLIGGSPPGSGFIQHPPVGPIPGNPFLPEAAGRA